MPAATREPRLLVLDAYAPEGRRALVTAGATEAGLLYARLLAELWPEAVCHVAYAAEADPKLPAGAALEDFDGAVWTGSSLTIHHHHDPSVRRQVELARSLLRAGVPCFGSCWAVQLATIAGGGDCGPSPKGREFGVARDIEPNESGRSHPLFRGKAERFQAYASHGDEVKSLPEGASLLASNDFSAVQAAVIPFGRSAFWAVQYHPEYDLHEIACLARLRADELVAQGQFVSHAALAIWADGCEALHADPARRSLARDLGVDSESLAPERRAVEVGNWLSAVARPRAADR